ncbi:uncharacterized protein B0I36DRAFT_348317 [Microdochium trichocladiopsis]|uniref:Uncharacterized protein n=1 Tax=Microdochium trichocladiopsis TaxID=1682393 RepID=A0A9P8Y933_9PEZI|nr:uncharacterized protein B0I36DRAFT_348317 [Microdochium trichocladiopsis]KAH7033228.1 hypothetical protein B0I36DRAFT_348317 [Microdochium trichocladiopsis]
MTGNKRVVPGSRLGRSSGTQGSQAKAHTFVYAALLIDYLLEFRAVLQHSIISSQTGPSRLPDPAAIHDELFVCLFDAFLFSSFRLDLCHHWEASSSAGGTSAQKRQRFITSTDRPLLTTWPTFGVEKASNVTAPGSLSASGALSGSTSAGTISLPQGLP